MVWRFGVAERAGYFRKPLGSGVVGWEARAKLMARGGLLRRRS